MNWIGKMNGYLYEILITKQYLVQPLGPYHSHFSTPGPFKNLYVK